ncbi:MAG TPA: lytic transglycosylase domain-containing protein [Vicinamibacterales bacterium]|nr:lytic transglycosylase domain-containing protein [Vicinamibacterales bacterium]
MVPQWNSDGLLGGPDRRHGDRRASHRGTADRRQGPRRQRMRTAVLAAAMSGAPMAKPIVAILPPERVVQPKVDVTTEYIAVRASEAYDDIIREAAALYDMDPDLIHAVMQAESAFHPFAVSRAGAEGLMQLMPDLADEMGVRDSFDPRQNIMGGVRYLKRLLDYHDGNLDLALASYNAGPGNVERYGGVPPFRETKNYIKTIKQVLKNRKRSDERAAN